MKNGFIFGILFVSMIICSLVEATPSTQLWIPSTDVQKFKTVHLNLDSYFRIENEPNGTRKAPMFMLGPTFGILPFEKIQAEAGFDLMFQGDSNLDEHPLYFHAKVGTPEDSIFKWSPAFAVGAYNLGIKSKLTTQNIIYGLFARTLPFIGRISAGYYYANPDLFVNASGNKANHGLLVSWDRTVTEISDKLWLAVDYQGNDSALGSTNVGFAWSFSPSVSVIFGYDIYTSNTVAGKDTFTVQVDINI